MEIMLLSLESWRKYAACGWTVAESDDDVGNEPWFAMYGTNVQRNITRAEMWAVMYTESKAA